MITILVCLCIITGATFALFTSKDTVNITVAAGQVQVIASMSIDTVRTTFKTYTDSTYSISTPTKYDSDNNPVYNFENAGTATLKGGRVLTLDRVTPGDEVNLHVNIENKSNVAIKYIVVATVSSNSSQQYPLDDYLEVYVDNAKVGSSGKTYVPSNWKTVDPYSGITSIPVQVWLPDDIGGSSVDDNLYQNATAEITFTVYAIQANVTNQDAYNEFGIAAPVVNP